MNRSATTFFLAALLAAPAGCGPEFKSEIEEVEYLNALSSPSVDQFRRRAELREKHRGALEAKEAFERARLSPSEERNRLMMQEYEAGRPDGAP